MVKKTVKKKGTKKKVVKKKTGKKKVVKKKTGKKKVIKKGKKTKKVQKIKSYPVENLTCYIQFTSPSEFDTRIF